MFKEFLFIFIGHVAYSIVAMLTLVAMTITTKKQPTIGTIVWVAFWPIFPFIIVGMYLYFAILRLFGWRPLHER